MALTIGNKVENNGATSAGKLTADEFNQLVQQINTNETSIQNLNGTISDLESGLLIPFDNFIDSVEGVVSVEGTVLFVNSLGCFMEYKNEVWTNMTSCEHNSNEFINGTYTVVPNLNKIFKLNNALYRAAFNSANKKYTLEAVAWGAGQSGTVELERISEDSIDSFL